MKIIGGEAEFKENQYNTYFTDSGRSSLRLILRSLNLKLVALPDYLCSIITDIFIQEKTEFIYYRINPDFSINTSTIPNECDAIYIIDYFGITHDYLKKQAVVKNKIVIEDNVFSPYIKNTIQFKNWISYNSYRKFSLCAEGSLIQSNIELKSELVQLSSAPFIDYKYKAKSIKYEYINHNLHSEKDYLYQFEKGEKALDEQRDLFSISSQGFNQIIKFHESLSIETKLRNQNYQVLKRSISPISFKISNFKSFFVFSCIKPKKLRIELMSHNIFLPIHWPNTYDIDNILYQNTLSIPLDSRYSDKDMERIINTINIST